MSDVAVAGSTPQSNVCCTASQTCGSWCNWRGLDSLRRQDHSDRNAGGGVPAAVCAECAAVIGAGVEGLARIQDCASANSIDINYKIVYLKTKVYSHRKHKTHLFVTSYNASLYAEE